MIDITDFESIKDKGEKFYKTIGEVYCPYFKENISFNAHGLEHLKFKRNKKTRSTKDQYMRFKLIHLAPLILNASHTLQGISETKGFERIRIHNRTDTLLKSVNYYEFIAVIKRTRTKVIIKQVDVNEKFFWSLIPCWNMNRATKERILYEGFPEED